MRSLIVLILVIGSVPVILVKPQVGIWAWSWISFMNPHRLAWGAAYSFPVAMVVGGATLVGLLVSREPKRPPMSATMICLILFLAWVSLTTLTALNHELAFDKWSQTAKIIVMTIVATCLMQNRQRIEVWIWVIAASIGFFGVRGGVFTIVTGGEYRVFGPPDSFISDNNQLALAMIMTMPLMRYLQIQSANRWVRLTLAGVMGLTLIAIIATYSRGGFIALIVMVVFLWFKSRKRFVLGSMIAASLVAIAIAMPAQWLDRIRTIEHYEEDASALGRFDAWNFGYDVALDHPLVGGGFKVFADERQWARYLPDAVPRSAHSIYFETLGEHGFVGLGLFLLLGFFALRTSNRIARITRDHEDLRWARDLAAMTQVGLIGYAAAGAFLNLGTFDLFYTLVAIMVVLQTVVEREIVKEQRPSKMEAPAVVVEAGLGAAQSDPNMPDETFTR